MRSYKGGAYILGGLKIRVEKSITVLIKIRSVLVLLVFI